MSMEAFKNHLAFSSGQMEGVKPQTCELVVEQGLWRQKTWQGHESPM